jgi:signal peptidase I
MEKSFWALMILITLAFVCVIISLIWLTTDVLIFTTYGTSMEPLISENNTVLCTPQADYDVGDVVAYNNTWWNQLVLHRIIYKEDNNFLMQGDNETEMDAGVQSLDDIICKVIKIN